MDKHRVVREEGEGSGNVLQENTGSHDGDRVVDAIVVQQRFSINTIHFPPKEALKIIILLQYSKCTFGLDRAVLGPGIRQVAYDLSANSPVPVEWA